VRRGALASQSLVLAFAAAMTCEAGAQTSAGSTAFKEVCAACHGPKGEGVNMVGPPLKGSPFLKTASADDIKALIKYGRTGKDKRYPQIPAGMPSQAVSEAELEALIPFVKTELQK
jgi:mono/diheme cytochrome c family protein